MLLLEAIVIFAPDALARADITIRLELNHFTGVENFSFARVLVDLSFKVVVLQRVLHNFVQEKMITRHFSRQLIVVEVKTFYSPVSDVDVTGRQGTRELVVVQCQVSKGDELLTQINGKGSGQLVST